MPSRSTAPATATRRQFVGRSALGRLGMLWSDWARAEATGGAARGTAKAVILIFNFGAPRHLDLWDLKPDAPDTVSERRGTVLRPVRRTSDPRAAVMVTGGE